MSLSLYRAATTLIGPALSLYLARRRKAGKEDPVRFPERLGVPGLPRPPGFLVWIHGASVGETLSAIPLIERLQAERNVNILMTSGTVTSAKLADERLPEGVIHQYVPVDRLPYVRKFLAHWQPDLALWLESEFWPNLLTETAKTKTPLILVNGRISDKSLAGWKKLPRFIASVLGNFDLCLGQSPEEVRRLLLLGAKRSECVGNIKFAAPPLPVDESELSRMKAVIGKRPLWLAASTHPGEEIIVGEAHQALKPQFPDLLTISVPRHPNRLAEVEGVYKGQNLNVAVRSRGEIIAPETDVYIADTMGEMGLFFRLAEIVFMGKSLVPLGGQNPLEPARLGSAIIQGPHVGNFREISAQLLELNAAEKVNDGNGLAQALANHLADPELRKARAKAAKDYAESEAGVLDRLLLTLAPFLEGKTHARP
jgi:3-deoxy-D-manno-octulosonic-acid transferase